MGAPLLSLPAEADLDRIFEQICIRSRKNAQEFLNRIDRALAQIEANPRAFRLRDDELPISGLRVVRAAPALLIYRLLDDTAEVVRIAHEKQNLVALLLGNPI